MKKIIAFGVAFAPFLVSAQTVASGFGTNVSGLIAWLSDAMTVGATLILAAAAFYVVWNAFGFVMAAGDEEKRAVKRSGIIYGVIGIVVIVSIWGIIAFVQTSTGLTTTKTVNAPVGF